MSQRVNRAETGSVLFVLLKFAFSELSRLHQWMLVRLRHGRRPAMVASSTGLFLLAAGVVVAWYFSPFNGQPVWSLPFLALGLAVAGIGLYGAVLGTLRLQLLDPDPPACPRPEKGAFLHTLRQAPKPLWICTECRVVLAEVRLECPECLSNAHRFEVTSERDVEIVRAAIGSG